MLKLMSLRYKELLKSIRKKKQQPNKKKNKKFESVCQEKERNVAYTLNKKMFTIIQIGIQNLKSDLPFYTSDKLRYVVLVRV